ncbi:MAG: diguanylate cyclase [Candidatus Omnitrophica bacterium]|nr:diguanylate cyclase [Candidatus Omnitrophota bacterium]
MEELKLNGEIFPKGLLKLMYLDDNEQDLEIMRRCLRNEKKIVLECVRTIDQFNAQMEKARYNCLIMDYRIPDTNIFDMVFKLFEAQPRRPIIIVSGVLDKKLSTAFQDFPFLRFIPKEKLNRELLEKVIIELVHAAQIKKEDSAQEGGALGYENKFLKQEFYIDVIETMDEGLVTVDSLGAIIFVNNTLLSLLNYRHQDLLGQNVCMLIAGNQIKYFSAQLESILCSKKKITFELACQRKDKTTLPVLLNGVQMHNQNNEIIGAFFTMTDMSEIKYKELQLRETNSMLEKQASTDGLTGLLNHRSLHECLELEFARAKGENKPLLLMMIDLDYFKIINHSLGHNFGDFMLKKIGQIIQEEIHPQDILGRHEADEFTILLVDSNYAKGMLVANSLRQKIAEYIFQQDSLSGRVTISIGLASSVRDKPRSAQELLNFGDRAVSQAKAKGRNTVVAYNEVADKDLDNILEKQIDQINIIEEQLVTLADSSKKLYMESARALIAALEAKDPYTKAHSVDVANFASQIATELGLSAEQIDLISDAAQLHDIGKIGIPESILLKPSSLTAEEYEVVKRHPLISIQILKRIKYMESELPIIQCHHERPDGKGYPAGLLLGDIPLGAQIIAVADSYDAMISLRPYRNALSVEDAVKELIKNSGTQFNSKVVLAFLKVILRNTADNNKDWLNGSIDNFRQKFKL